jgi:hypothetical protein
MPATVSIIYLLISLGLVLHFPGQHAAVHALSHGGVSAPVLHLPLETTEQVEGLSTLYSSYEAAGQKSCIGLTLNHDQEPATCGGHGAQQTEMPGDPSSNLDAPLQPLAVPMDSSAAARRLQQVGSTTLRPNSATTRCLDTLNNYALFARLDLAASCTGSVHQSLLLPVPGSDLTMEFVGSPGKCLDVAWAGTSSPTNTGVSGHMCGWLHEPA